VVKVIDTGIGIEKTHLPHIFKKFYQGRSSRTGLQDGSGIGLALTKEIVELHGGSIGAESLPGEGSAFTLLFPALPHTAGSGIPEDSGRRVRGILIDAETPHHTTEAPAAAEGKGGKNRSVLVVEDNEELLSLLRNELEVRYKVYTARNGGEALVLLNHVSKPDIIVSDIMMPGMDGTILFRTLKKRHDFADVPFLFLTARAEKEEKLALLSAGAVDYIHKPFDMEELGLKIEGLLSLRDSIRRAAIVLAEAPGTLPDNLTGPTLTKREQDISRLLQVGFSDKEIAAALGISARTVSNILGKLYRRTGVSGRLELVRFLRPS
jgi:DNA-binding NarL/FixJ family response regulator